jgi:phosphoesterase RecJ-like protein
MNAYLRAYEKILKAKKILLLTHQSPDGDALSSVCALTLFLDKHGKDYKAFCYDPPPKTFDFLPGIDKITHKITKTQDLSTGIASKDGSDVTLLQDFDLIIVVDCGSLKRTNIEEGINRSGKPDQTIIEFDHHPKVEDYSDIEIKDPQASSTTEILYYFFKKNDLPITKDMANCILTGILTDTANFLHPTTTQSAIKIASKMLLCGASFPKITRNTWQNKDLDSMKVWGAILSNLRINKKYNIAFSVLTHEQIKSFGGGKELYDGIAGFLSNINDVKAVIFLREEEKGKIKGSLRTSRHDIDVSELASFLGGGGHPNASGFMIEGSIEKTEDGWRIV